MPCNDLDKVLLEFIREASGREVPLFEIILKFRSVPYICTKSEIMSCVKRLEGSCIIKSYVPVKCRLVPAYRIMDKK